MLLCHNWKNNFKIRIAFETILHESSFGKVRHRLSKLQKPKLEFPLEIVIDDLEYQEYLSAVLNIDSENFKLILPVETIQSGDIVGKKIFFDTRNFFFLRTFSNLFLCDSNKNIYTIDSYEDSFIEVVEDVSGSFPFYFVINAILEEMEVEHLAGDVLMVSLNAKKIRE